MTTGLIAKFIIALFIVSIGYFAYESFNNKKNK